MDRLPEVKPLSLKANPIEGTVCMIAMAIKLKTPQPKQRVGYKPFNPKTDRLRIGSFVLVGDHLHIIRRINNPMRTFRVYGSFKTHRIDEITDIAFSEFARPFSKWQCFMNWVILGQLPCFCGSKIMKETPWLPSGPGRGCGIICKICTERFKQDIEKYQQEWLKWDHGNFQETIIVPRK